MTYPENKKTLVMGASSNPERYSYLAIKSLLSHGHHVEGIGRKNEEVLGVQVHKEPQQFDHIHTVTLYLNPNNQRPYYDYIITLKPQRIIFNPGTENAEFQSIAQSAGIQTIAACTLVMLSTGQY
jgi:predicted CoA-binding protein